MTPIAFLHELVARGMSWEDAAAMAAVFERSVTEAVEQAKAPKARSANAERQARFRERKALENESATRNVTGNVTRNATGDVTPPRSLDKERSPGPPKEINPSTPAAASDRASDEVWSERLEEAKLAGGDGLNLAMGGMHTFRDLKTLVEPSSGEPCEWPEVLDAIRIEAAKAKTRGKPIRAWTWVHETALAMRDRRLAGLPPAESPANGRSPVPSRRNSREAAYVDRMSDVDAAMRAAVGQAGR